MTADERIQRNIEQLRYVHRHVIESLLLDEDGKPTYKLAGGYLTFHVQTFVWVTADDYDEKELRKAIDESFDYAKPKYQFDTMSAGMVRYSGLDVGWHIECWKDGKPLKELPFFQFQDVNFRVYATEG